MPNQTSLDQIFRALSDPTRRAVVERLAAGPTPVSALAAPFDMALPSFLQHLGVLESSGLVRSDKEGRVRTVRLEPRALDAAEHWMTSQRRLWKSRLDQLDDYLRALDRPGTHATKNATKSATKSRKPKEKNR